MIYLKNFVVILCIAFSLNAKGQDKPVLTFDPIGGVYEKETTVTLDAGEGATIYYTLDGSRPGTGSRKYKGPITINEVKVLRAVAYVSGKRSDMLTYTYVCDREYDLPVVSVVTDTANLWSYATGIYVKGCCADTIEPYLGANFWMDWQRLANIEMYDTKGELCFNQQAGMEIFGGFSRMLPQKSLAFKAKHKFGDNKFRYPIFPGREHTKYKSFILRNSGGDFKRTHLRDAFMTQLAKPTGIAIQEYQPAVVFINGKYWGIQNIREKINEHYLKQNFGVDKDNVDILRQHKVARHGTSKEYKRLLSWLQNHDLSNDQYVTELDSFLDIENYIAYNIAEVYSDNRDAGGNIRYFKERNDSAKWRWVFYDIDQGLGNNAPSGYKRNTLRKFTSLNNEKWPDPPWSTFIIRKLLENEELQTLYINTFADHLNTAYHPDTANNLLDSMVSVIDYEMEFHQKRWGATVKNWHHHLNIMRKFINNRPHYCRMHIMEKFGLNDTLNISINHPGTNSCDIKFNTLDINRDYKGIYFKDVEVEITVEPKHDYELVGWKDSDTKALNRKVKPSDDLVLEPILQPKPKSDLANKVFFNEIAFYQPDTNTSRDWIELYNYSEEEIDLSGWTLTDDVFENGWKVPDGTTISSKTFLVLSQNVEDFKSMYPADSVKAVGDFGFGLSSNGELVKLYDRDGFIVDSLNYREFIPDELPDTLFTLSLGHIDSSATDLSWMNESPTPCGHSLAYLDYLDEEERKAYWTKVLYIGGGSFFFISVVGILFFRSYRKRKKRKASQKEA